MLERDLLFDKRIIDRNLKRQSLTKKQLTEHNRALVDLSDKTEEVVVGVKEGEFIVKFPEVADEEDDLESDSEE